MKFNAIILLLLLSNSALASWVTTYQEVTEDIKTDHSFYDLANKDLISSSRDFNELEKNYGNEDLKNIYWSAAEDQVIANNENIRNLLNQINPEAREVMLDDGKFLLSKSEVRKVFRYTSNTRVVKREERYDKDEVLGFCFGRAFIAHYQAKLRDVHPESIKKIWVVGDMEKWGHHVATMLRSKKGWMVIDTYTGLLTVEKWMQRMEKDKKRNANKLMFFVTNATRFGHQNNNFFNSIDLFNVPEENLLEFEDKKKAATLKSKDFYKGYFIDFFRELDKKISKMSPI